jgi:NDP-sugar pyrophosphorylase family protein
MKKYKLLITTSGVGSRLGDITKYTNKSLIKVGSKPVISHIVDLYPEDIEIVVTLGYFGI